MEHTFRRVAVHAATAMVVSLTACSVPGQTVLIGLPEVPGHYQGYVTAWIVRWWDGEKIEEQIHDTGRQELRVPLSALGAALPVVWVTPLGGPAGTIRFEPYGGWSGTPGETILLDRYGGEVARIAVKLADQGIDPALLNLDRLRALVRARLPATPRILDTARLQAALARRQMRSYHVSSHRAPAYQVRLPVAGPASLPWVTDDMWDDPITPAPAGPYELFSVPVMAGEVRRLWRPAPDGEGYQVLVIYRTPDGNGFHRLMVVTDPGAVPVISRRNLPVCPAQPPPS